MCTPIVTMMERRNSKYNQSFRKLCAWGIRNKNLNQTSVAFDFTLNLNGQRRLQRFQTMQKGKCNLSNYHPSRVTSSIQSCQMVEQIFCMCSDTLLEIAHIDSDKRQWLTWIFIQVYNYYLFSRLEIPTGFFLKLTGSDVEESVSSPPISLSLSSSFSLSLSSPWSTFRCWWATGTSLIPLKSRR